MSATIVKTSLRKSTLHWIAAGLVIAMFSGWAEAVDIQAKALLKGAAMLEIDGQRRMLRVGQNSPEGVTLISATPRQAVIELDGQRSTLGLSTRISSHYTKPELRQIAIPRDQRNQYITNATINGRRLQVLVDTGANVVAISGRQASQLGIDYQSGTPSRVITASGEALAYRVVLDSVSVGGIKVSRVQASVVEGSYPEMVLLGMSFLQHVEMKEQSGSLILQAKF